MDVLVTVARRDAARDADLLDGGAERVVSDLWPKRSTWSCKPTSVAYRGHEHFGVSARMSPELLDRELVLHAAEGWELCGAVTRAGARAEALFAWTRAAAPCAQPCAPRKRAELPTSVALGGLAEVAIRVTRGWHVRWVSQLTSRETGEPLDLPARTSVGALTRAAPLRLCSVGPTRYGAELTLETREDGGVELAVTVDADGTAELAGADEARVRVRVVSGPAHARRAAAPDGPGSKTLRLRLPALAPGAVVEVCEVLYL
jgi:hypothetical protein